MRDFRISAVSANIGPGCDQQRGYKKRDGEICLPLDDEKESRSLPRLILESSSGKNVAFLNLLDMAVVKSVGHTCYDHFYIPFL